MQAKHPNYDKGFKIEAVRLVQRSDKLMSQVSKDLGISGSSLSRWCRASGQQGERAFVGSGHQQPPEFLFRRLHREIEVLRQERDINNLMHFGFELSKMFPDELQFADELLLLRHQMMDPSGIFGPNTLCCGLL